MKISGVLITALCLLNCHNSSPSTTNVEQIDFGITRSYKIGKDTPVHFSFKFDHKSVVQFDIHQCNIDVEVKYSKDGITYLVDRPTGSNSNESFLYPGEAGETLHFQVYSIDPINLFGYIDIKLSKLNEKNPLDKIYAERNYLLGYRNRISSEKEKRESSIEILKKSIHFSKRCNDRLLKANALIELGMAYHVLSMYPESLSAHFQALKVFEDRNIVDRVAYIYHEIGASYHRTFDLDTALYYYHKSIENWKNTDNLQSQSFTLSNISYLHSQLGNFQLSKDYLDVCFSLAGDSSKSFTLFSILQKLGVYYYETKNYQDSIKCLKRANKMAYDLGYHSDDSYIFSFLNLGSSYKALGDLEKARDWTLKGIQLAEKIGLERTEGVGLWSLGQIELSAQNFDKAKDSFEEALEKNLEDWFDNTYLSLGTTLYRKSLQEEGSSQKQQENLSKAINFFKLAREKTPDSWTEAQSLFWEAKINFDLGHALQIENLHKAISNIEDHRHQTEDRHSRVSYFASNTHFYKLLFDLLFEQYDLDIGNSNPNHIFRTTEKIRARTLLDLVNDRPYLPEHLPTVEEVNSYYRLLFQMEEKFDDEDALAQLEAELIPLARKMARLDPSEVIEPEAIRNVAEVQAALEPGTMLLTYAFGMENLYLLALDAGDLQVHNLGKADDLKTKVDLVSEYLKAHPLRRSPGEGQRYDDTAKALSKILLGPLTELEGVDQLVFIPDNFLQRLPFAALPVPGAKTKTLGERFQTAVLPSASVWMALKERAAKYKPPQRTIALLANPVFNGDDPRLPKRYVQHASQSFYPGLPGTQKEAESIARLAGDKAHLAMGFAANRDFVKGPHFKDYRYIHFATHGDIDPENPGQSSLVLSRFAANGQPIDGMLRLSDISQLEIHADLVSLSACETANGKMVRGEGLMSLARGFMAAGVPRVLGTLWKVPDNATAHFMTRFYEGLLRDGLRPAKALQKAQMTQARDPRWQDPHYWAGFVLIGDWR